MDFAYIPFDRATITLEQYRRWVVSHTEDVQQLMTKVIDDLSEKRKVHDWTKLANLPLFYKDEKNKKGNWCDGVYESRTLHTTKERHHLNQNCPQDVNLFDVIEMVTDCVAANRARKEPDRPNQIDVVSKEVLLKAYANTITLIGKWADDIKKVGK
ncbi:MAG: DUF5662 family protein [Mycoplasmataceae bacterium]|jgi:hypothetical protein|nr:DUF5662 family protein [Mycoplasmataceae bacterium]